MDHYPTGPKSENPFARHLQEIGLCDMWCLLNPGIHAYTSTYGTLSGIDLALGTELTLPLVSNIVSGKGDIGS